MAAGAVSFDLREVDGLAKILNSAKLSSQDRVQLLQNIGVEAETQTQQRFDDQTDPEGKPWQPLAEKTKRYYANNFPERLQLPLLVWKGGLRDSIESQTSDSWSVLVGATKVYAATHQFGRDRIPARPYAGVSSENAQDLVRITQLFLSEQLT